MKNKKLYWALIGTFTALYLAVAFVSTLHAITFFQLANSLGLAILLGTAYEIGQAAVLFSILMSENKNKNLAWAMMFLLTALQVTANVYASFKFMSESGTTDWTFWQKSILFGVQVESQETYKIIISWITGALLPMVALGMTALVSDNIHLIFDKTPEDEKSAEISRKYEEAKEKMFKEPEEIIPEIQPTNKIRGWHLKKNYVDEQHQVFNKGKFSHTDLEAEPTTVKKA